MRQHIQRRGEVARPQYQHRLCQSPPLVNPAVVESAGNWVLFCKFKLKFTSRAIPVYFGVNDYVKREWLWIRSGASGLPYYCAQLVCVPAVLGLLAVWRHNKPKTTNQTPFRQNKQTNEVCAAVCGMHVAVCASGRVWPLPGGLIPPQLEAEYSFSGSSFSPANKQTKPKERASLRAETGADDQWVL